MPTVVVTRGAADDLNRLMRSHNLPRSTPDRVRRNLDPLRRFPLLGAELYGRWAGLRFILGPWRWLLVIYRYEEANDRVTVVGFEDGRSGSAPRSGA